MKHSRIFSVVTGMTMVAGLLLGTAASAQTTSTNSADTQLAYRGDGEMGGMGGHGMRGGMMRPVVVGTVASITGNSLTVSGREGFSTSTPLVTYTVDATGAKVEKDHADSTIGNVLTGDTVVVEGTISGTAVTATEIRDGALPTGGKGGFGRMGRGHGMMGSSTDMFAALPQGNGQPIVGGKVTSVTGNSISITNASNVSYTVNATGAKITKAGAAGTISDVVVGDTVLVQGTVNGNAVVAATVNDAGVAPTAQTTTGTTGTTGTSAAPAQHRGFFGMIGGFFSKLFGF